MNSLPTLLIITHHPRPIDISGVFRHLSDQFKTTIESFDPKHTPDLRRRVQALRMDQYDHVLIDLPFKKIHKYPQLFRNARNLTIYEEDAYLDAITSSRWHKKFRAFYRSIPGIKVINTGYTTASRIASHDVDATAIPKGFDKKILFNEAVMRDIPLGFIGSLRAGVYEQRRQALIYMQEHKQLAPLRTEPGEGYRKGLNRIGIFFSADIGLHEYMAKNFEAMACGCAVVAYRQGEIEETGLGFQDGQNVMLYSTLEEAERKVDQLLHDPELRQKIASAGESHVHARHEFETIAAKIAEVIRRAPRANPPPKTGLIARIKGMFTGD